MSLLFEIIVVAILIILVIITATIRDQLIELVEEIKGEQEEMKADED